MFGYAKVGVYPYFKKYVLNTTTCYTAVWLYNFQTGFKIFIINMLKLCAIYYTICSHYFWQKIHIEYVYKSMYLHVL